MKIPDGWRRLAVGEQTRDGDWLDRENITGQWEPLSVRHYYRPVQDNWAAIIRRTTATSDSPNVGREGGA